MNRETRSPVSYVFQFFYEILPGNGNSLPSNYHY